VLTPDAIPRRPALQGRCPPDARLHAVEAAPFQLFGSRKIDQVVATKSEPPPESRITLEMGGRPGFENARSARDRSRAADGKRFFVYPPDIPNTGVLFVDRRRKTVPDTATTRLTECRQRDIVAFYSVTGTGADNLNGHGLSGMVRVSALDDGGLSWALPPVFEYSKQNWEGARCFRAWYSVITPRPAAR